MMDRPWGKSISVGGRERRGELIDRQFPERKADNIFAALNQSMPSWMERYSTSKLLEIFAVREIAKRGMFFFSFFSHLTRTSFLHPFTKT